MISALRFNWCLVILVMFALGCDEDSKAKGPSDLLIDSTSDGTSDSTTLDGTSDGTSDGTFDGTSDTTTGDLNDVQDTTNIVGDTTTDTTTASDTNSQETVEDVMGDVGPCVPTDQMVVIAAGTFPMGCSDPIDTQCGADEYPQHDVLLSEFEIDVYDVTKDDYQCCVEAGACLEAGTTSDCTAGHADRGEHPINCVDFVDANAYCLWVGKRLPTEAEWEKAARSEDGRVNPWGNELASCTYAVTENGCGTGSTMPVGSKPAGVSPYGVHDMVGNVWNLVADRYSADYFSVSPSTDPTGPDTGDEWVIRGSAYWHYPSLGDVRAGSRRGASFASGDVGFRCAK